MSKKPRQADLFHKLGPAGIGAIVIIVLTAIIFLALAPANAIGTVDLPQEVQPVTISVALAPVETPPDSPGPSPEPTATPAPTATVAATVAATAAPALPTATPVPPTATPLPPLPGIEPRRLRIPNLGINAAVEQVGLDSKNRMDIPRNIWNVAWYKLGPQPGQRGNAVIDGHLDGPSSPAVFWNLNKLVPGNRIYIQDDKGQEKVFEVFDTAIYEYDKAPLDRIFGPSNDAQLNLITCNGTFDRRTANYDKRFVVYSRLVNP